MTSESTTTKNDWRRTSFKRLDGSIEIVRDDWCLYDDSGRPIARIYHFHFGPDAGKWAWFVQVALDGVPANGGSGIAETGREARLMCERLLPPGTNGQPYARMQE